MLTVLCTAIIFHASTAQSVANSALPALTGVTALALAQQPDQPGRKSRSNDQLPSEVREAIPAAAPLFINPPEVRMIPIQHAAADDIARFINNAVRDTVVFPDPRTNSVIYMGPPGVTQKIVDMVAKMDVPSQAPADKNEVLVQPLKHRNANDIARQLSSTLAARNLRIAADDASNSIIFAGPRSDINDAIAATETLDQESPPAQLEFAFFSAEAKKDETPEREWLTTPEDLKRVGEEIAKFGVIEYQGRLSTSAMQESSFMIGGGIGRNSTVDISGKIIASPADGPVKLEVMAKMALNNAGGPGPTFALRTTVTAKRGEYVVIGSAPTGWNPGDAVILVLHVQK